jgi:hypothetical protein
MGGYISAVSGQRLGKHVPTATNRHATMEELLETEYFCPGRAEELYEK